MTPGSDDFGRSSADIFTIEILKEIKEISNGVAELRTDVALIKSRQNTVMEKVDKNKSDVDAYCLEDRKMHDWLKRAFFIETLVLALMLLGGETAAKEIVLGAIKLIS